MLFEDTLKNVSFQSIETEPSIQLTLKFYAVLRAKMFILYVYQLKYIGSV